MHRLFEVTLTDYELKMLNILSDLKANHHASALKVEFETEGAAFEEASYLAKLARTVGLDFVIKIGGCAAVSDIKMAKELNAAAIVAPMIESAYAFRKFIESIDMICDNAYKPELYINIETVSGVACINDIISTPYFNRLSGIVFGRTDMVQSLGNSTDTVESADTLITARYIAKKVLETGKRFIIGGGISSKSSAFLHSIDLSGFETRKIIFDKQELSNLSCSCPIRNSARCFPVLCLSAAGAACPECPHSVG